MKKILITIIFLLSCIGVFSQTTLNPSGTWTAARNIINANFSDIYDSLVVHQLRLSAIDDSIASHLLRLIAVEDSISTLREDIGSGTADADSSVYATRFYVGATFAPISNPVFTGIQKVSTTDTLATQAYARQYGGTGTVTINDVQNEIADSLNPIRSTFVVGDGTVGPFFDGTSDGGQLLYFYGDNGFWTALQGGAPTANRSYRLPIAALPSAGNKAYLNIDEYGNMGFIDTALIGGADSSIYATRYFTGQTYALVSALSTLSTRTDSIVDVLADTMNIETLLQIDLDTDTIPSMDWVREYVADHGGEASFDTAYIHARIDSLWTELNDTVVFDTEELGDVAPLLTDEEPIFVFGLGSGQTADTAVFNDNAIAGAFFYNGEHTLKITSLRGVLAEGTGTETISVQVSWHATFKSGSATNINSSALAITSITTGTSDTSFANDEIPPGVWVWCTLSGVSAGNRPSMLVLTMSGYKIVEL